MTEITTLDEQTRVMLRARRREDVARWRRELPHATPRDAVLAMTYRYGHSEWRSGLAEGDGRIAVSRYYERAATRQLRAIQRLIRMNEK